MQNYVDSLSRQKSNKENRKPLILKDFRFLLRDSVGIRQITSFSSGIRRFTGCCIG